jgi:opacity protein-like surface antigen
MIPTRFVAAATLALSLGASTALAQNFTFGLQAGAAIPTGDYGDAYKTGFQGGVTGDWWVSPAYALGVDVNGNFHNAKDDLNRYFTDVSDALGGTSDVTLKATVVQFTAHAKFKVPMSGNGASPYVQAGLGGYNARSKLEGGVFDGHTDSVTKFGFNVGAGIDVPMSPAMSIGVIGAFHDITDAFTDSSGEKKSAQYVQVGAMLTFMTNGATR